MLPAKKLTPKMKRKLHDLKHGGPAPYDQKEEDVEGSSLVIVDKAYKNEEFLMSRDARNIRILCEFEETLTRLQRNAVYGTFLFFGSARAMYRPDWERAVEKTKEALSNPDIRPADKSTHEQKLDRLQKTEWLCEYMEKTEELSRLLTEWAMSEQLSGMTPEGVHPGGHSLRDKDPSWLMENESFGGRPSPLSQRYVVATGGGPGLMEAANKGASSVPGARSAGFAISLPFEKGLNQYVSKELAFVFHYFFTRKYWMMYPAKVLIACPGGFGTLDELFESVTLRQTGKKPPFPTVLIGKEYWEKVINWSELAATGTISQSDVDSLYITDSVEEAFDYIKEKLIATSNPSSPMRRVMSPVKRDAKKDEPDAKKAKKLSF